MKVLVLMENTALNEEYLHEHGLSLYIETSEHRVLFDMGQSDGLLSNAEKMGIDLSKVDLTILSHGHYDHGGGLEAFLKINDHAPVYLHKKAFELYYHGKEKYIGLNQNLKLHPQLHRISETVNLDDSIQLVSLKTEQLHEPINSFGLSVLHDGVLVDDQFEHELMLLIKENGKKILISGCSHKGILNIAAAIKADVVIGGFHFKKLDVIKDRKQLVEAAEMLKQTQAIYYTGHCTGEMQASVMKEVMQEQLQMLHAGLSFEL